MLTDWEYSRKENLKMKRMERKETFLAAFRSTPLFRSSCWLVSFLTAFLYILPTPLALAQEKTSPLDDVNASVTGVRIPVVPIDPDPEEPVKGQDRQNSDEGSSQNRWESDSPLKPPTVEPEPMAETAVALDSLKEKGVQITASIEAETVRLQELIAETSQKIEAVVSIEKAQSVYDQAVKVYGEIRALVGENRETGSSPSILKEADLQIVTAQKSLEVLRSGDPVREDLEITLKAIQEAVTLVVTQVNETNESLQKTSNVEIAGLWVEILEKLQTLFDDAWIPENPPSKNFFRILTQIADEVEQLRQNRSKAYELLRGVSTVLEGLYPRAVEAAEIWKFTQSAPVIESLASDPSGKIEVRFTPVEGAVIHQVQVSTDPDFRDPLQIREGFPTGDVEGFTGLANGIYSVRVRSSKSQRIEEGPVSQWSAIQRIEVGQAPPPPGPVDFKRIDRGYDANVEFNGGGAIDLVARTYEELAKSWEEILPRKKLPEPLEEGEIVLIALDAVRPTGGYAMWIDEIRIEGEGDAAKVVVMVKHEVLGPEYVIQALTRPYDFVKARIPANLPIEFVHHYPPPVDPIEPRRTELINQVDQAISGITGEIAGLEEVLEQAEAQANQEIAVAKEDISQLASRLQSLIEQLSQVEGVSDPLKAEIGQFLEEAKHLIEGLDPRSEVYYEAVKAFYTAPLSTDLKNAQIYLDSLEAYLTNVKEASTLEELLALQENFPRRIPVADDIYPNPDLFDLRPVLGNVIRNGNDLSQRAQATGAGEGESPSQGRQEPTDPAPPVAPPDNPPDDGIPPVIPPPVEPPPFDPNPPVEPPVEPPQPPVPPEVPEDPTPQTGIEFLWYAVGEILSADPEGVVFRWKVVIDAGENPPVICQPPTRCVGYAGVVGPGATGLKPPPHKFGRPFSLQVVSLRRNAHTGKWEAVLQSDSIGGFPPETTIGFYAATEIWNEEKRQWRILEYGDTDPHAEPPLSETLSVSVMGIFETGPQRKSPREVGGDDQRGGSGGNNPDTSPPLPPDIPPVIPPLDPPQGPDQPRNGVRKDATEDPVVVISNPYAPFSMGVKNPREALTNASHRRAARSMKKKLRSLLN